MFVGKHGERQWTSGAVLSPSILGIVLSFRTISKIPNRIIIYFVVFHGTITDGSPPPPPFASPCLHPSVSLLYRLQSYLMDHKDPERLVRIPNGVWRILHFLCYQMNIQRDVSRR